MILTQGLILPIPEKSIGPVSKSTSPRNPAAIAFVAPSLSSTEKNQDICSFLSTRRIKNPERTKRAFLESVSSSLTTEDYSTLSWLLEVPAKNAPLKISPELLTVMGLDSSAMILGRRLPDQMDPEGSITLLEEARAQDPDNGALDLYLASLYQLKGERAKADEYLERGLQAKRFDVYIPRLVRTLMGSAKSPVAFIKAAEIFSVMPIPDLNPLRDYLRAKTADSRLGPAVFRFAQGLVDEAVESHSPFNHLDWWLSSYVMGANILQLRGEQAPRAFELHKEFGRFPTIPSLSMEEPCNSAELERSISEFQSLIRN